LEHHVDDHLIWSTDFDSTAHCLF